MFKIRKISFKGHPILGNLELDFCDVYRKAVDTVIFAGENGTGKSTVLETLYQVTSHTVKHPLRIEMEDDENIFSLDYEFRELSNGPALYIIDNKKFKALIRDSSVNRKYPFTAIFSDVEINFHSREISSVTSVELDRDKGSKRSTTDLPTQIKQLLVDIKAMDSEDLDYAYSEAKRSGRDTNNLKLMSRMPRFTNAFSRMFDDLSFKKITNHNGKKVILFEKYGDIIPIEGLSSGEKQIVYRGCFLLKDVNATKGAFVFIDEPEISLHPKWQMRIMDYYKGIFTDEEGKQTSQIFAATHSPFIIHNDMRKNDKVLILERSEKGLIVSKDKIEYYKCNSIEAVQDAFSIPNFSDNHSTVFLEGSTDKMYFNKAKEVYGYNDLHIQFDSVGYECESGKEFNMGKEALNKAVLFLRGRKLHQKHICLFDSDANKKFEDENNVIVKSLYKYKNAKGICVGVENALVLDDIDIEQFRSENKELDNYGATKTIPHFNKMECCNYICSLDQDTLKKVFSNLKCEIDELLDLLKQ
ncbi:MAG: ATP-binding protein [Prevotellaceae bacterium]|nr:ATP-binding protein [Prevotellaceae bacterium]